MKNILIVVFLFTALTSQGQWSKQKRQKGMSDLEYTIDTFNFKGETILMQRFTKTDIATVYGGDPHENRVALAVMKFQGQLDGMHKLLLNKREMISENVTTQHLDDIKREKTDFDYSHLEKEYQLYYKYRNVQSDEEVAAEKELMQKELAMINAEDSNVITEFDKALAARSRDGRSNSWSVIAAMHKIGRIEKAEADWKRDSLNKTLALQSELKDAIRNEEMAVHRLWLERENIKKYGAKNGKMISEGKVALGWSKKLCEASWGEPYAVTRRRSLEQGVREVWLYSVLQYLVFENGVLTVISE